MELLKQDELAAFREIYDRNWKSLYNEACRVLNDREAAEEIVQEVFTVFWEKRELVNIKQTISGYLYRSVRYLIIDAYRKELVRAKFRASFAITHREADTSTEDLIMLKDLTSTIDSEVQQLPPKCRSIYELSRKEHKSNKEIASYLGISEKTVENQLTRALNKLRFSLSHYLILLLLITLW